MTVVNKIDKFLNEAKKSESGYYKVGVANDYSGPIKVMEIAQESNINKARQAYAGKYKYVFTQPASKKDFMDFSNGKTIKWVGPVKEAMQFNDRQIEHVANSLTDKEWFVLGIFLGYKSNSRKSEFEHWSKSYNVPITEQEYDKIVNSLSSKQAINKGKKAPQTRTIWEFKFGRLLPSQVHQWVKDLKF